ncbi:hypothetical protein RB195_015144 [Necator americanus]|uniref:Uncharacterized protein n=1 Tax=Necator americanus TaxID=51031 RepID=A0ABR1E370_NECAM
MVPKFSLWRYKKIRKIAAPSEVEDYLLKAIIEDDSVRTVQEVLATRCPTNILPPFGKIWKSEKLNNKNNLILDRIVRGNGKLIFSDSRRFLQMFAYGIERIRSFFSTVHKKEATETKEAERRKAKRNVKGVTEML